MRYVYFTAAWCQPCKAISPLVEAFDNIEKVDVDSQEGQQLAANCQVRSVPTIVAIDDGVVIDGIVGSAINKNSLETFVRAHG